MIGNILSTNLWHVGPATTKRNLEHEQVPNLKGPIVLESHFVGSASLSDQGG